MSSGTQVDLDWAEIDVGSGGTTAPPASDATDSGAGGTGYLTDEEILGIEPVGAVGPTHHSVILSEAKNLSSIDRDGEDRSRRDSSGNDGPQNDNVQASAAAAQGERGGLAQMPEWMRTATAADTAHGAEAQALWREHQEFRAAFPSAREARAVADEARAIKELLPGGVKDVVSLREATASVDRIDAALFSGDARAQSEVVTELARANPAAFRSMFAEAARVLAGMGAAGNEIAGNASVGVNGSAAVARFVRGGDIDPAASGDRGVHLGGGANLGTTGSTFRNDGEVSGTFTQQTTVIPNEVRNLSSIDGAGNPKALKDFSGKDGPQNDNAHGTAANTAHFDPAAYASFERATNDAVARDVRGSIGDTLVRVMPEGVAEGAARRIGEDIFNEVHRALAADRALSEQVAAVLRDRRFDGVEQQRVTALLAGRAKQLVPSVARRVIGEWTSTVLNTARSKAARQAVAASRVDIAAAGGSLDSMPLRAMSSKEVNYASMSDEEILGI